MADHKDNHSPNSGHSHHYILPDSVALKTLLALGALTAITVGLSYVHLGPFNFIIGMLVATVKAFLVCSIFMNLRHDDRANALIFGSGFVFLAIFFFLTAPDVLFRGDVYVDGKPLTMPVKGISKFKKAWEPTPELVAHGKALFAQNCVSCHGEAGHGDGVAAGALNPKPRNFTLDAGWKNGRKPTQIFKTLKEGIPGSGMASFSTLAAEDRWALSHFVASLGPNVLKSEPADFTAIGVDTTKDAGSDEAPSISIKDSMKLISRETSKSGVKGNVVPATDDTKLRSYDKRLDAETFSPKQ